MKTVFKLFALEETRFLTGCSLASDGINTYDEMIVVRKHMADFDSETEAFQFMSEQEQVPEHGFEIIKTYTK